MLQKKLQHLDIILASQSPRRQELLKELDIDFRIETRPVDEVYSKELKAGEITAFLSELKAKAFQNNIKDNQLIITSDTIVWLEDAALEKPKDLSHAKEMLASMSGKMHEVFTSVTFTTSTSQDTITDSTKVYFKNLTDAEISYYVETYKPMDRAGAYGIQDWIGYTAIEKLDGCYYNVMGLPLPKVYQWLSNNFQE
ncbi:septum formation protein [Nonlabens sp. Hel1_33_55]|uniref:Maf family nucleotide pyrophosphatase n=1 Tax=Nonlabens sp. Hel1_33_55 TaxID=1336802 RepID=UPI000875F00B|nr:Maf family nucleotide pyrophosphatase [Nonlabens sp. Hel1_33_55]SCY03487.1 septum formation protein [Nonlabens sp. Hel1_33_55]